MRNTHLHVSLALVLATGCGIPKEEHQKALNAQKAAFDSEMQKMQVERDTVVKERDGARADVKRLGGEVSEVSATAATLKNELGQTSADLASPVLHAPAHLAVSDKNKFGVTVIVRGGGIRGRGGRRGGGRGAAGGGVHGHAPAPRRKVARS